MGLPATRAATRSRKAFPVSEDISTPQTPDRSDNEPSSLDRYGAGNMRKMLIDLFFADSQHLGEFPGTHVPVTQEDHHLLTNGVHVKALNHYKESTTTEGLGVFAFV